MLARWHPGTWGSVWKQEAMAQTMRRPGAFDAVARPAHARAEPPKSTEGKALGLKVTGMASCVKALRHTCQGQAFKARISSLHV